MHRIQQSRKRRWRMLWQRLKEEVHKYRESVNQAYEDSYFVEYFFPGVASEPEAQEDLSATPIDEETEAKPVSDLVGSSSCPLQWVNDSHPNSQMNQFGSHQQTSQKAATGSQDMSRQEIFQRIQLAAGSAAHPTAQQNLVTTIQNVSPTAPQSSPDIERSAHQDMVSLRLGVFFQVTQAYKCFMRRLRRQRSNDCTDFEPATPRVEAGSSENRRYKGIRQLPANSHWVSEIRPTTGPNNLLGDKKIWLGSFRTAEAAARANDAGRYYRNKREREGADRYNFPDSPSILESSHPCDDLESLPLPERRKKVQKLAGAYALSR